MEPIDDEEWMLVEPTSNMRSMAKVMRDMYVALRHEGFNFREATTFVAVMAAELTRDKGDPET